MLYALLGILIFTMVGIVIFNAATANLQRFNREQKIQQSYLSVSSAADVFVDAIAGDKVTYTIFNEVPESISWKYVPYGSNTPKTDSSKDFSKILEDMVKARYNNSVVNPVEFVISASLNGKNLENVNVTLTMVDYDLNAVFTNDTTDESLKYYLTVHIPFVTDDKNNKLPVLEQKYYDKSGNYVEVYKIEWDVGNITIERGIN